MMNATMHKLLYLVFFGSGAALSFYKLGLFASLLEKSDFGLYTLVFSSYVYLIYFFSFGSNEYVLKQGSLADTSEKKQEVRNRALWNGLLTTILGIGLIYPLVLWLADAQYRAVFEFCALLALIAVPFSALESYFRSEAALLKFSGMMAAKGACVVLLTYVLSAEQFGDAIWLEFAGFAVVVTIVCGYLLLSGHSLMPTIGLQQVRDIIQHGYAFSLSTMFKNSITVIDKILMTVYLGTVQLGYYAFVLIIYQAVLLGSAVIMSVVGPQLLGKVRDGFSTVKLARMMMAISGAILLLAAISYTPVSWLFEWGVSQYFSQYHDAVTYRLFDLIYLAAVFTFVSSLLDWFFLAISKESFLTSMSSLSLIIAATGFILVGEMAYGIVWFVSVFALTRVLMPVVQLGYLARHSIKGGEHAVA